ncbi:MAG: DUF502 domain-containing protein [Lautropia sp.]
MFRKYFVTGLILWVPLAITLWVLNLIVTSMDQSLALLPPGWRPRMLLGYDVPGLGVVLTVLIVFITGVFAANLVGGKLVAIGEQLLARIPIVRSIYSSVKQVSDTILSPSGNAFRQALLVEYPRRGVWTIAFLTGTPAADLAGLIGGHGIGPGTGQRGGDGADFVSVYVPTTPNPTSGFFLMMRRDEVVELDMSVDAALKYVVSMGVVAPPANPVTQIGRA